MEMADSDEVTTFASPGIMVWRSSTWLDLKQQVTLALSFEGRLNCPFDSSQKAAKVAGIYAMVITVNPALSRGI